MELFVTNTLTERLPTYFNLINFEATCLIFEFTPTLAYLKYNPLLSLHLISLYKYFVSQYMQHYKFISENYYPISIVTY